tara:strand:+ start:616 stop:1887 length:1272 start_codon:yes stop_codon:yes gene_type:complete
MKTIKQLKQQPKLGIVPVGRNAAPTSPAAQPANIDVNQVNQQVQQLAQQLAAEMLAEQKQISLLSASGRTFTKFDMDADVVEGQSETVTAGLWSGNVASLTTYFTSSTQTESQRRYYVDILDGNPSLDSSAVQFAAAYGNALGSGSNSQGQLNDSPSKAIYSQYRQLLLNPTDSRFTTAGSGSTDSIYVVNFKRNRLKERLDAGNFEMPLRYMSASLDTNATGSNVAVSSSVVVSLIDDSSIANATVGDSGRVYNIVSGSIDGGVYNSTSPIYYGLVYPDFGTLVLDGNMLDQQLNYQTNTGSSSEGNNHFRLFHSVSGSSLITNPATSDPYGFLARNSEKVTSTHYFVRIKNADYNFSNNPSYITGSDGQIAQSTFIGDPKTYITTVGLYNDAQELLAVSKLSKPLLKSFQSEALIRVKLDF